MKGASKVIMGATLAMVVTLAIVLGLILVLLAELYCTLLLRRRRQLHLNSTTTTAAAAPELETRSTHPIQAQGHSNTPPGVLQAPRNLFYPIEKQSQQLNHFLKIQTQQPNPSPQHITETTTTTATATTATTTPPQIQEPSPCVVYISNPIFDNMAAETPFETPDSSPSRLTGGGSSGEEEIGKCEVCLSPPLLPMKKLPAEASSVSLRDGRSLGTSGSDSVTVSNNGLFSSSSCSPATSPSW